MKSSGFRRLWTNCGSTSETFAGDLEGLHDRQQMIDQGHRGTDSRPVAAAMPWVSLLQRPHRGKGAAVRAGMLAAHNERVVLCDADLSMPVNQFDRLLNAIDRGCDVAVGSRALPGSHLYEDPLKRRIMSKVFNFLVRTLVIGGLK